MFMFSIKILCTPPDASLPIETPANGVEPLIRRMVMSWLGRPYDMPYSSHPLFMDTRSSPVDIYESSMQMLLLESVKI